MRAVPEDTPLGVRVTFEVTPFAPLSTVKVEGKQVLPDSVITDSFKDQYGKPLNLKSLQQGIKKLNQWYQDKGYVLAQVINAEAPKIADDGTVTLIVAEGVVEDIQVHFLNKDGEETDAKGEPIKGHTRQFIITREVQLKPGQVFNRAVVEKDLQRIFGLGIFEDVRLSLNPGQDPRKVVAVLNVIEKNNGSLAAGAGVSSSTGLFGTLSYQQQNLGGNNQKLGGEVQIAQRGALYNVSFTDPWIAGDVHHTSYTVDAFDRRAISNIFTSTRHHIYLPNGDEPRVDRLGAGVTFTRPLGANPLTSEWRGSVGFEYQRVSIIDSNGVLRPRDQRGNNLSFSHTGRDDLLVFELAAVRDRRNDPLRPTRGDFLRFSTEQSVPVGSGSILLTRLRGSYSYYLPVRYLSFLRGAQTLALNFQTGTAIGDLPPYEAFALGGSNSVRGYDEGDLGAGRSFVQTSAEYRFPLFAFLGGALFFDFGSDLGTASSVPGNPAGIRGKSGTGYGYGLGVRIQSPLGPIRVDYGINESGGTHIHFGIGERF